MVGRVAQVVKGLETASHLCLRWEKGQLRADQVLDHICLQSKLLWYSQWIWCLTDSVTGVLEFLKYLGVWTHLTKHSMFLSILFLFIKPNLFFSHNVKLSLIQSIFYHFPPIFTCMAMNANDLSTSWHKSLASSCLPDFPLEKKTLKWFHVLTSDSRVIL